MLYTHRSFTVPASAGTAAECARVGHTQPDARGRCFRCAAPVPPSVAPAPDTILLAGDGGVEYERVIR